MRPQGFEQLSEIEWQELLLAPVRIVALVGAADGDFDEQEEHWSSKMIHSRTIGKAKFLRSYYELVLVDFREKVHAMLGTLPQNTAERNESLSAELAKLNEILAKLGPLFGGHLYKGFMGLAHETAIASGGFFRLGAVSKSEKEVVDLPMLTHIDAPELKDENPYADIDAEKEEKDEKEA